ncbi:MAG TPA: hypothetical protein VFA26_02555, partial [Gemmataceae bacterium]|nr:hypothetical protein [Gemmataceae bacterium]
FFRRQGVRAAGQSSWGPAVFGVTADEGRAEALLRRVGERFGPAVRRLPALRARNRGAEVPGRPGAGERGE